MACLKEKEAKMQDASLLTNQPPPPITSSSPATMRRVVSCVVAWPDSVKLNLDSTPPYFSTVVF